MNDVYKVTKVIIKLGGKEVEMTTEDARKLRDSLNELFGDTVRYIGHPVYTPNALGTYPWRFETTCGGLGQGLPGYAGSAMATLTS